MSYKLHFKKGEDIPDSIFKIPNRHDKEVMCKFGVDVEVEFCKNKTKIFPLNKLGLDERMIELCNCHMIGGKPVCIFTDTHDDVRKLRKHTKCSTNGAMNFIY